MTTNHRIADLLNGAVEVGGRATVQGWIRTRRDSKAGLSFLNVSDGSCFAPLQVVAPGELDNYQDTVLKITTGCAVRAEGELVESRGKGQSVELRADRIEVIGWVDDPESYPMQAKRHTIEYLREVAHLRPRTTRHRRRGPRAAHLGPGDPPVPARPWLPVDPHPDHHRQRLRGRR